MNEKDFKKILTLSPANPPALFHQRMEETLAGIVRQEENAMNTPTKALFKTGSRAFALALIITLLLCSVMLRHERDLFLDDMSIDEFCKRSPLPVQLVENDGQALYDALRGRE